MKITRYFAILFLVLAPGLAMGYNTTWTYTGSGGQWDNAANWDAGVPDQSAGSVWAWIPGGVPGPVVTTNVPFSPGVDIGQGSSGTGIVTVTAGGRLPTNYFWLGTTANPSILNVDGGIITANTQMNLGQGIGGSTVNITNGGIVDVKNLYVGYFDNGSANIINVDDGYLRIFGAISGQINSASGIDIEAGEINHVGNVVQGFYDYFITPGKITGYDGTGIVTAEYVAAGDYTRVFATIPEPATMVLLGLGGLLLRKKK